MKFIIRENEELLILQRTTSSSWKETRTKVIIFMISLLVFVFPYSELSQISKYAWIIYFTPIFPLIKLLKSVLQLREGATLELNKNKNELIKNSARIEKLSNINRIDWNIDSIHDHCESYLELRTINNHYHRISTTSSSINAEHLELGKRLSKFLGVNFYNNNPLEEEVIYYGGNVERH